MDAPPLSDANESLAMTHRVLEAIAYKVRFGGGLVFSDSPQQGFWALDEFGPECGHTRARRQSVGCTLPNIVSICLSFFRRRPALSSATVVVEVPLPTFGQDFAVLSLFSCFSLFHLVVFATRVHFSSFVFAPSDPNAPCDSLGASPAIVDRIRARGMCPCRPRCCPQ